MAQGLGHDSFAAGRHIMNNMVPVIKMARLMEKVYSLTQMEMNM